MWIQKWYYLEYLRKVPYLNFREDDPFLKP
jgi:hypothetical protein